LLYTLTAEGYIDGHCGDRVLHLRTQGGNQTLDPGGNQTLDPDPDPWSQGVWTKGGTRPWSLDPGRIRPAS
jgi:hypothetical protein